MKLDILMIMCVKIRGLVSSVVIKTYENNKFQRPYQKFDEKKTKHGKKILDFKALLTFLP